MCWEVLGHLVLFTYTSVVEFLSIMRNLIFRIEIEKRDVLWENALSVVYAYFKQLHFITLRVVPLYADDSIQFLTKINMFTREPLIFDH